MVVLVVALLFMFLWVRSRSTFDAVQTCAGILGQVSLFSSREGLALVIEYRSDEEIVINDPWNFFFHHGSCASSTYESDWVDGYFQSRKHERLLWTDGDYVEPAGNHMRFFRVNCLTVALPLTLAAAWLLLSKPRSLRLVSSSTGDV